MSSSDSILTIKIVTPTGMEGSATCDSITLNMVDDATGNGRGSMGIHPGFPDAVISLSAGPVVGRLKGEQVLKASINNGFATVKNNVVSVITDSLQNIEMI